LAVCASVFVGLGYLASYVAFIALSRMLLSLVLFAYSRKVEMAYPWILYLNQLINASVKVYAIFRLSKQRWSNRGNQTAGAGAGLVDQARSAMAAWCTAIAVILLFLFTAHYAGLVPVPT
ncbi:MAG TPA: transcriptional regulator, partial [Methyloceanibacter sp.]|nr:transcriptional regulator [Methyloceanibacter sp.]